MQDREKLKYFKNILGKVFSKLRNNKISLSKFAMEYDIDKGTLSKLERGLYDCRISTAWKISEANGIKFSDFAKLLEKEVDKDFTLIDL